jgi:hypothetical protein
VAVFCFPRYIQKFLYSEYFCERKKNERSQGNDNINEQRTLVRVYHTIAQHPVACAIKVYCSYCLNLKQRIRCRHTNFRKNHMYILNLGCFHPVARVISYDVGFNPSTQRHYRRLIYYLYTG